MTSPRGPMNQPDRARVTLGVVPYLNAAPLLEGLREDPHLELVRAIPSRLSDMLLQGEVDAAIIPIVDAAASPEFRVLPGISITSKGPVGSVRLFYRGDLREVGTVHLDPASKSSALLVRILLEKTLEMSPGYASLEEGSAPLEAFMKIGDDCLFAEEGEYGWIDLGEAWTNWTGLPFVYAAWVSRGEVPGLQERLLEAKRRGLAGLDGVIQAAAERTGRDPARIDAYLREMMRYDLGKEEQEAIALFFEYAAGLGLVREGMKLTYAAEGA